MSKFASLRNGLLFLAASLTLGLAPFLPEPHIWANLKWIWGGAVGMEATNWWDTLMHGAPWLLLISWTIVWLIEKIRNPKKVA
jgi:hypothetical protein